MSIFEERKERITTDYEELVSLPNKAVFSTGGVYERYENAVVTAAHIPPRWRYDYNPETNPYFAERLGINAALNSGAIYFNNKFYLMVRIEGHDRKSFFGLAESDNGIENFRFTGSPVVIDQTEDPDTNVYDVRLTAHEDGWIYGLFCTERKDPDAPAGDESSATAQCGIIRSKDLENWERLPDLKTNSSQQRNVVLHPELIDGQYALYTRPQDSFIEAGSQGGIGWGLSPTMENAEVKSSVIMDCKVYHTINEVKNGQGPSPIKTEEGWLHLAHGVRNTAAGLRYVLYMFLSSLDDPSKITHRPSGYFIAPEGEERVGDVSNVVFSNGWIQKGEDVFIYYASSDTRCHVATTTINRLLDYVKNTPEDPYTSRGCVDQRRALIEANKAYM
ncbi:MULTISPECIES: glycosidase [unclassified Oceanispirochaeta]|uniref:glycoside hydrolase family 130 protein n=1 Tax=unclassified Oceanispirochaeta TaxID=2635722 RepID=UPI000E099240|nr:MULTISPECIES: glycosidase [unclassified Oceanispirochaeta]MBF9018380.1 glycosidase [Oceanispirochaeta sp. M2]NPD74816.1 glycosidase [Oceanispirochaeta sp. M1]RDG29309.1 glycosidase [Oceanispirochaeta sp. M1]